MGGERQNAPETRLRGAVWVWLCWLGGIVFLYMLSTGPVEMMEEKCRIREDSPSIIFYLPVSWTYIYTPLRRPLGIYWHLWAPNTWDSRGKER